MIADPARAALPWASAAPVLLPRYGHRPAPAAWHGRPEWLLEFGWPRHHAEASAATDLSPRSVACIGLSGLPSAALLQLQVIPWSGPSFEFTSLDGGIGRGATAGALLEAVSAANGHTGMVLDLDYLGLALCLGRFSVQLQVRPESAEALSQALVAASLR